MSRRVAHFSPLLLSASLVLAPEAAAQSPSDELDRLVVRLAGMTAATGYEQSVVDTLLELVPGARRDPLGSAVRPARDGRRRLVACALDEPGWIVGGVRPDGWLTLRRTPGAFVDGRDQQLEGARVTVFGQRGAVPGVVAVRSIHLTRGRGELATGRFTADSALVDLGATSAEEVSRLGVGTLAVVSLAKRPHRYGSRLLAAPWAGRRAACAALVRAAGEAAAEGVVVAFVVQHELAGRGLAAVAQRSGPFDETLLVDAAAGTPGTLGRTADAELTARRPELGPVTRLTLPVRYGGTPVETLALDDVAALATEIGAWMRTTP